MHWLHVRNEGRRGQPEDCEMAVFEPELETNELAHCAEVVHAHWHAAHVDTSDDGQRHV